ncbi:MAG TPA: carbon monoxide dehydrogenase subunit G [Ktedonobacteraceae bacterium]|jgi:carbon monoxide dehydrogenase subunit G|nr:carbon monoxide dehydrogenase subunit G [Ktedonobacteraceae bacterium]
MKLKGSVTVNAPQQEVWQLFLDPARLCRVIPGCEQIHQIDETHYDAFLAVKVQFMTIRSHARGSLLEAEAPHHLTGELMGEPVAMAGAFRARLSIDLIPASNATEVLYMMDLTMLGRLASLGEALVRSTSQQLTKQFAENVSKLFP